MRLAKFLNEHVPIYTLQKRHFEFEAEYAPSKP